jgi:hypothetical protein
MHIVVITSAFYSDNIVIHEQQIAAGRLEWLLLPGIYAQAVYAERQDIRNPCPHSSRAGVFIKQRIALPSRPHPLHHWAKLPQRKNTKDCGNGEGVSCT